MPGPRVREIYSSLKWAKQCTSVQSTAAILLIEVTMAEITIDGPVFTQRLLLLLFCLTAFASSRSFAQSPAGDWTQFGWDVAASSAPTEPTGITASNVASLQRHQVTLDG